MPAHRAFALVSPALALDESAPMVGKYDNQGIDLRGNPYGGTVEIEATAPPVHRFTFVNQYGAKLRGIGIRDRGEMFAAYLRDDCRVIRYRVRGATLEGIWADSRIDGMGIEIIPPSRVGVFSDDLAGGFTAEGSNPDGTTYKSTGHIWTVIGREKQIYQFDWIIPVSPGVNRTWRGVGFRDGDRLVVAAGPNWYGCAPAKYRVAERGRVLHVTFADAFTPSLGLGTGMLQRLF